MGSPLSPGTILGHYKVLSKIGAGGMGEVYLAQDTRLDRKVALKILPEEVAQEEKRMHRFSQEAKAASALNHPNILTIYEIGETDGRHFIVTEFVEGVTVRERLAGSDALTLPEALDIAVQVSSALAAAHAAGIIHRDIKPDNLMLRKDGFVKVLDFGLAKLTLPTGSEIDSEAATRTKVNTEPGLIIGTVAYMSPEQARGLRVDARTDIWSLGVVLYEMIVGQTPFVGKDVHRQIIAIQEQPTPPLSRVVVEAPERLEEIVSKTLAKNADERYQTAKDLLIDLKRLKQKLEIDSELERTTPPDSIRSARMSDGGAATITDLVGARNTASAETQTVSNAEAITKRPRRGVLLAGIGVLALALVVGYFVYARRASQNGPGTIRSLAVLPFVNSGNNADAEYLSDGISESLINSLSQLPGVKVIARSSSFRYKGKDADPQEVANALGVQAILTGRVLQRGDDLLISVELVDARDKTQVWGEQYNRKAADVLQVQSEISREVAEKLRVRLTVGAEQKIARRETANPQAYGLLLKGRFLASKGGTGNRKNALEYFKQAIAIDPNYAAAYAEISASYSYLVGNNDLEPKEFIPKAEEAAHKALALDESLAEAHLALANLKLNAWDWANAEREYRRAIELNPNLAEAYRWYSVYNTVNRRHDEAIALITHAKELDPLSVAVNADAGFAFFMARRYDEALESMKQSLQMNPEGTLPHLYLGYTYAAMGRDKEAVAEYQEAITRGEDTPSTQIYLGAAYARLGQRDKAEKILRELETSQRYVSPGELTALYTALGEREKAFASLEKAYTAHDLQLQYLGIDPTVDELRADPRFQDLLRRVGLRSTAANNQ
ncbi:MAG: protein kinase [bacterium]